MNKDDLMNLMGVQPSLVDEDKFIPPNAKEQVLETEVSRTALVLDIWDLSQGTRLVEESLLLRQARLSPTEMADMHGVAFLPDPELVEKCTDEKRHQYIKTLMETEEYIHLHQSTEYNLGASDIAATHFGLEWSKLKEQEEKREEKEGSPSDEEAQDISDHKAEVACMRSVAKALEKATEEVQEFEEACRGLGGDGGHDDRMDTSKTMSVFQRIKNNAILKSIFNKAGRYRRVAQARQQSKVKHGYEDMVGIKLDDQIEYLLSEELTMLVDEDFELDTLRRLVEKETLATEYQGLELLGKGPVIVCVDESGSMSGEPIANAKAFALAMCWIAKHQKRPIYLIAYAGGTEGNLLPLLPGKWDDNKLLDWLCHFYSGGTRLDVPISELPNKYWQMLNPPRGKTDLIILTDAKVHCSYQMEKTFLEWKKKEKVRCISMIIGKSAGVLQNLSDEVHFINRTISADDEAVLSCFSI